MELDSGQQVAELAIIKQNKKDGKKEKTVITLEVQGSVKVYYKDSMYKCASQMPDELLKIFHDGYDNQDDIGLNIIENNWFEVYVEVDGQCVHSDVCNPEGENEMELLALLLDVYREYKEIETEFQSRKKFICITTSDYGGKVPYSVSECDIDTLISLDLGFERSDLEKLAVGDQVKTNQDGCYIMRVA